MRYFALDTETTGVDPAKDRIIEFAITQVDDGLGVIDSICRRVNPGIPIPPGATKVHGIRDEHVRDLPDFSRYAGRLQRLLGKDAVIIAYNGVRFDVPLLHYELQRYGEAGLSPETPIIDPLCIYRRQVPHTLTGALYHYCQAMHWGAHGALADVNAMLRVLREQRKRELAANLDGLVESQDRKWLDVGRHFYVDEAGIARFGFGKHRDEPLHAHSQYARWMLGASFPDPVKNTLRSALGWTQPMPADHQASQEATA